MSRSEVTTDDACEPVDAVLLDVVRDCGASRGMLYVLPEGGDALWLVALTGTPREMAVPWTRVGLADPVPVADAVRSGRPVWIGDMEEMARRYPRTSLVLPYAFALAAAPLTVGDAVVGGLVLLWPASHPAQFSAGERAVVDAGCRRLGRLLHHAPDRAGPRPGGEPRLLPHPSRARAVPAEGSEPAAFIARLPGGACALDDTGRFTFVTPEAARLLGTDATTLVGALPWEALPWMDVPDIEDHYRSAVVSQRPTTFRAVRPPDHGLLFALYPDSSGMSVRITRDDPRDEPSPGLASASAAFDEMTVSDGIAGSDESAEPAERSEPAESTEPAAGGGPSRAGFLYHLMHLAATFTEAVGVEDVVDQAADQLMPALGATAMAVSAPRDGRLRILGHRGYGPEVVKHFDDLPLTADTPAVRVMDSGSPHFFSSFYELQRSYPGAVQRDDKASWAFLPLIASGRAVGSLVLAYDRERRFPPPERAALTALAGLVGQALERGRLYDTQYAVAHQLQAALLPRHLPAVPGLGVTARYRSAGHGLQVGGDFYDLIRLNETTVAAAIGDVQGHDIDAAALMGQVRTAVHGHAAAGASPGDVLRSTNRLLVDLDAGRFASCLYADLDLARHAACLASAGHPPALLRDPDGRTEVLSAPPGLLLGIDREADYKAVEFPLRPGSALVLYTDGLVERPGVDLGEAIADLADLVSRTDPADPDAMADTLIDRASDPADDVALLIIHVNGTAQEAG
ncbi:SpoIIE family protein phosphatase [Streptomyces spinosisporus]|uniref:SpoIIE family protein phosphatase n=1 Tax=Streptomyces spinosisporus TaxID=2927582 RepID=A0ABS9XMP4_9ACTN|nr:SpoIIE family protein phosphatase [Streptomyces spinosisporus]MCI3243288.1 SpoIIE family protein phosphatase [Streptomyces spinosisporus]